VIYVTQHGRPTIVLMDYDHYEMLMEQLEELSDLVSLRNAADESTRPYEEFLAEFESIQADDQP
jgi:PHD/YefM family antitoxin component YafN of YafNO toxin-antitoxin module